MTRLYVTSPFVKRSTRRTRARQPVVCRFSLDSGPPTCVAAVPALPSFLTGTMPTRTTALLLFLLPLPADVDLAPSLSMT